MSSAVYEPEAAGLGAVSMPLFELTLTLDQLIGDRNFIHRCLVAAETNLFTHLAHQDIPANDLAKFYAQAREHDIAGWAKRWRAAGLPSAQQLHLANRRIPPGGETSWTGPIPLALNKDFPLGPVAFVIYEGKLPIYVGSTMTLRNRIKRLVEPWQEGYWRAWPGKDRQDAYRVARELRAGMVPA